MATPTLSLVTQRSSDGQLGKPLGKSGPRASSEIIEMVKERTSEKAQNLESFSDYMNKIWSHVGAKL